MAVDERLTLPTISNQQFDRHREATGYKNDDETHMRALIAKNDSPSTEDGNDKQRKRASLSSLSKIDPKKAAFMHRHGLDLSSSESDDDDVNGDAGQTGVCCY